MNSFKYKFNVFFGKYLTPILSTVGVCAVFILPMWYGIWYPVAQEDLHKKILIENKNSEVRKPDFIDVSIYYWSDYKSPVLYCGFTLVLIFFTQFSYFKLAKDFSKMKELNSKLADDKRDLHTKINDEQEAHSDTRQLYYDSLKDHLRKLCFNSDGFDGSKCRASIYRIDREANLGRLIFRCSGISKYENKGRVSIPLTEGVVAATVQNGEFVYISVSGRKYAANMRKALNEYNVSISDETLSTIQMKSNTYYGRAIRDLTTGDKIAILIMESLDENAFNQECLNGVFERQNNDYTKWVQHIARIDSVLNPYGVIHEAA